MVPKGDPKKRQYTLEVCDEVPEDVKQVLNHTTPGIDNRDIRDDGFSQNLTREELEEMRYVKGTSSKEIVEQLVENSKTFTSKTQFAQEKYLKKKEKKYFEYIQIRRPTIRHLAEYYFRQEPEKIMNLRKDSLSQILSYANISSSGNFLLYESGSNGLLPAAILNAIGDGTGGRLVHMHPGNLSSKQAVLAMNFPSEQLERCVAVNIYSALRTFYQGETLENSEEPPQKIRKLETDENTESGSNGVEQRELKKPKWMFDNLAACELMKEKFDGLVIASREHPTNILNALLPFVKPSRPVVVYNQSREVLADLYVELKSGSKITAVRLTSNWLRNYQVLPNRTHPDVMMNGNGGFLLCGYLTE